MSTGIKFQKSLVLTNCKYQNPKNVHQPGEGELKVFSMNVRSLYKLHISHFREEIFTYSKFDILCFNEANCCVNKLPNGIDDLILDGFHEPFLQEPLRKSGKGGVWQFLLTSVSVDTKT